MKYGGVETYTTGERHLRRVYRSLDISIKTTDSVSVNVGSVRSFFELVG